MRIGHGYDVHRFCADWPLVLGGVAIPSEQGLLGHSDADVLTHAIMDSILGAMAQGDIGKLFPDNDDRFKGISSMKLLAEVVALMEKNGFAIGNIDCTVIAQKPKLAPFIIEIRKSLAKALHADISQVSVKATTEEGLGLADGGIGAHCVCLLNNAIGSVFGFMG